MPKTIFGTSEKSNFILNMNKSTVEKWKNGLLYGSIIILLIGGMVITLLEKANAFMGSFLYVAGFSCILFYIVLLLRKDIKFKDTPAAFLIAALAVLAAASYYKVVLTDGNSAHTSTALLGETGRYEGLLALLAYFGIFLLAACVTKRETVKKLFMLLMGAGIVQAAFAVMQHIPWGFPSNFRKLPSILLLKNVHLASGLSDSPIFYGTFLTIVSGIAIAGAVWEKNAKTARFYGAAVVLFFLTGLFTSSVIPLIGIGADIIIITVLTVIKRKSVKFTEGILKTPLRRLGIVVSIILAVFGIVSLTQGIYLRDKAIAYTDAFNRLFIVASPSPINEESLWEIGAERSIEIIKDEPILGVGPDLMATYQLEREELRVDSIDRSYNEYLYTAATRGLPSLIAYAALLIMTIVHLCKRMKGSDDWYVFALFAAILGYAVQAFFSASAVTAAPFFWLIMGLAYSDNS